MRKSIFTLAILIISAVSTMAHTIGVGYVERQEGGYSSYKANGKTACSAAILLEKDKLKQYVGNEIQSVRISLENTKLFVDSVVVWVRQSLDGENLASGKLTRFDNDGFGNMQQGWNEVALDKYVSISADSKFYVGYTYYQRTPYCVARVVTQTSDGKSFIKLGSDASWTDTNDSMLAIEAGIDGNKMPGNEIWLMGARGLILPDGTRQLEARIYNRGQNAVNTLGISYNGTEYNGFYEEKASIQPDHIDTLTFDMENAENVIPGTRLPIEITKINGSDDEKDDDNSAESLFNYLRTVLIEEFTTEQCPNCPRAAEILHDLLENNKMIARHMAIVCHHSGYRTDRFTTDVDLAYEWFYPFDGTEYETFAPSLMYDRRPFYKGTNPTTSVPNKDNVLAYIKSIVDGESALVMTANAYLSSNNKTMTVEVKGKRLSDFGNTDKRITVYLTEDNVLADGQAGSGTDTYYHQHIMRGVNATWGELVEWNGDSFTYTCSFNIDRDWKIADLKVVASVGDYDSTNPANCKIENSAVAVPSSSNGINNTVSIGEAKPTAYYSIDGQRLSKMPRGICIVKYSDGTMRKVAGL